MQTPKVNEKDTVQMLKEWINPILIAIIGFYLSTEVLSMRTDVRNLLTIYDTFPIYIKKIEALEHEIGRLKEDANQKLKDDLNRERSNSKKDN
jgi:hypothetical protein